MIDYAPFSGSVDGVDGEITSHAYTSGFLSSTEKKMDDKVRYFIESMPSILASESATHSIDGRKIRVTPTNYNDFWSMYLNFNDPTNLNIVEFPTDGNVNLVLNIRIDTYDPDEDKHGDVLEQIIYKIQTVIVESYDIKEEEVSVRTTCIVLENTTDSEFITHRFQLRFPFLRIKHTDISGKIISPVISKVVQDEEFRKGYATEDASGEKYIINEINDSMITTPNISEGIALTFWNSVEHDELIPYTYFNSYTHEGGETFEVSIPTIFEGIDALDVFRYLREDTKGKIFSIPDSIGDDMDWGIKDNHALSFICSQYLSSVVILPKKGRGRIRKDRRRKDIVKIGGEIWKRTERLLGMLKYTRFIQRHFWLDVGRILYNVTRRSNPDLGLAVWREYTRKYSGGSDITEEDCEMYYNETDVTKSHLTINTLGHYAQEDSPKQYTEWHTSWCIDGLKKSTDLSDVSLAIAFYRCYWLKFMCEKVGSKIFWYYFDNNTWKLTPNGHKIRNYLQYQDGYETFPDKYDKLRQHLIKQKEKAPADKKRILESEIEGFNKVIKKLKNGGTIKKTVELAADRFTVEDLDKIKNKNPSLTGVANGIVEICEDRAVFRPGKPEDYVTLKMNYPYKPLEKIKHTKGYKWLIDWFQKCYPDKELFDYVLKILASLLYGRNESKRFIFHSGEGDNSKSMVQKLIINTLGDYAFAMNDSAYTQTRRGGGPSPMFALTADKRVVFIAESDSGATVKSATFKQHSGGDAGYSRKNRQDGGMVEVTFTVFWMCNKIPEFEHPDKATKKRFDLIPYLTKWVPDPPKDPAEQKRLNMYKMDPRFEKKQLRFMGTALISLMVAYYEKYALDTELKRPKIVEDHIKNYWDENDIYNLFAKDNVIHRWVCKENGANPDGSPIMEPVLNSRGRKTRDKSYVTPVMKLHNAFCKWFGEFKPKDKHKVPARPDFVYIIKQRWGIEPTLDGNEYEGISLKIKDRAEDAYAA